MDGKAERISAENYRKHQIWYDELLPNFIKDLADFPYAFIKGDVLSKLAYGDVGYRDNHDVDILVPKGMREDLKKILHANGFIEDVRDENGNFRELTRAEKIVLLNSHQDIDYIKYVGDNFVNIDVNYDLFWGEYTGKQIDIRNDFLSDTHYENIFGQKVKALSKVKSFIQLCLHHYREMNAIYLFKLDNPFRITMFRDVYYLLKTFSEEETSELCSLIDKYEIKEYIYYVTYLTAQVYQDDKLREFLNRCATEKGKYLLDYYGLTELERKKWHISLEERMASADLYSEVEPYITQKDKDKVDKTIGFITAVD